MTEKKNKKCKQDLSCQGWNHEFLITGWMTKGGQQRATEMRCRKCLMPMDLEELASKEWREAEGIDV